MSRKIAPRLTKRVMANEGLYTPEEVEAGRRELRALLSVARAVGEMKRRAWNRNWEAYAHRAFDAHDRLERVSGRKP